MANRGAVPALTVRNMFAVVPVPKSNTRDQVLFADGLTHVAMVKLVSPLTMPDGMLTYSLAPLSLTALPIRPATRGPVAPPPPPTGASAHSVLRIALLMLLAIVVISFALAVLPSALYAAADASAPEYQNELSVRSCGRAPKNAKATASASFPTSVPPEYSIRLLWLVSNLASVPLTSHSVYLAILATMDGGPPCTR